MATLRMHVRSEEMSSHSQECRLIFDKNFNRPLIGHQSHTEVSSLPRKDFESLDYDRCYNEPYEELLQRQNTEHSTVKLEFMKWVVTFLIGLLTGLVALFIDFFVKLLSRWKFHTVNTSLSAITSCTHNGCLVVSLLILLLFNVGFVIVASCLTVFEPVAGGSGIPEIKSYLNGVKIPRIVRLHTIVAKAVGVLFSVAGGLFVGKEGPMIHSGAIIGAGVPQFQSIAFKKINVPKYSFFRSDRDKRDFVAGGAAAGVAAAFGAPIGGVLFSLEEGCSFWNQKLTWRTFFCSMAATFTLNFFLSGLDSNAWGYFYLPGLINFGIFGCKEQTAGNCRLWNAVDLFIFVAMGIVGGLLGALFNAINKRLAVYRMRHVQTKHKVVRILEAILVASTTTTMAFVISLALGKCQKISGTSTNATTVRIYLCEDGYYNDMATLLFNSQEEGIKQLFHQEETGTFSLQSLGLFFLFFFFFACWTYGVAVPSGLFVPSLFCGAAYGRFVSNLLSSLGVSHNIYSGTFSLIGAAAFLGGVVRMTISLTVILIESTNEISYGLPLMLVLMVAKWSGDHFNEGLYDIHIHLRGVPLLEWDSPTGMERLKARDIMDSKISFLFPQSRVSVVRRILKTTVHNAYPVIRLVDKFSGRKDSDRNEREEETERLDPISWRTERHGEAILKFEGLILRSHLTVLLKNHVFYPDDRSKDDQTKLTYEQLTSDYPRFPDIFEISDDSLNNSRLILALMPLSIEYKEHSSLVTKSLEKIREKKDVTPYMNPCPYIVYPNTPVPQVFSLFRSMGLRHLPVVDHNGEIFGIITRHNLTHESLNEKMRELHRREQLCVVV